MSDVQLLFLVLAALYAWECACWLPRGSVAFVTSFGRKWRTRHPGALAGNQRGGFIFAAPLPPLGSLLTANQCPLSLSPEAVLAYVSTNVNPGWRPGQSARFIRLNEIRKAVADGKKVRVNGEILLKLASPTLATHFASQLERLRKLDLSQRAAAIDTLARDSLDTEAVECRWRQFLSVTKSLRILTNTIVACLFIFAPAIIWYFGFKLSWLGLLLGLFALTSATATLFHHAHKELYPPADEDRLTHTLTILLSPLTAARAHDILSRPLVETFHPLVVAKVFLPAIQFRDFARRILLDIRYPALPVCPGDAAGICSAESFIARRIAKGRGKFPHKERD